jgi:phosphoadenosine phosphosulfate reductase
MTNSYVLPTPVSTGNGNGHFNGAPKLPTIAGEVVDPAAVSAEVEAMEAEEAIAWAIERFHPSLRFAISFQKTSSVLVDLVHGIHREAHFFYVDTGLLFPETYATRDALAERYELEFERVAGDADDSVLDGNGCCAERKVELMRTALTDVGCWVSGIRRVDSATRAGAPKFAWDERFGLWKLNPIVDWDEKRVWSYIRDHHVPYNELHDRGYPSIGCMPCTTVALEGAGERAGRWAGTDRTECGIHG